MGNLSNWGKVRLREDAASLETQSPMGPESGPCLSPRFPYRQLYWTDGSLLPSGQLLQGQSC